MFAVLLFSNASCDKKIKVEKTIDGASVSFTAVPQPAGDFNINEAVTFDLEAELKKYDITLDEITKVNVQEVLISLVDSSANPVTFNIIDKVNFDITSQGVTKRLATKDPVPHPTPGLTTITPDMEPEVDYVSLIKVKDLTYNFTGHLNAPLDHAVQMKVTVKWKVTAELDTAL